MYSYGVMLFIALIAGILVVRRELDKRGFSEVSIAPLVAVLVVSGLIGARLFYVIGHFSEYQGNWGAVFSFDTAGMVYYGCVLFAIPAGILIVRRMKLPVGVVADAVGLALPLGLAIARIGCFLNGCCGGKPTGMPWGVTFPGTMQAVHPTQIYEIILDLAAFAVLLGIRKYMKKDWDLFLISMALYASIRFFVEFFRFHVDPRAQLFFQVLSVVIFAVVVGILLIRHRTDIADSGIFTRIREKRE